VAQGVGPEFKTQYHTQKKISINSTKLEKQLCKIVSALYNLFCRQEGKIRCINLLIFEKKQLKNYYEIAYLQRMKREQVEAIGGIVTLLWVYFWETDMTILKCRLGEAKN
jgi:succinyl-CoA synthetase beta subunit